MEDDQVVSALEATDELDEAIEDDLGDSSTGFCNDSWCKKFTGS
jgi:hypothetical protein